MKKLLKLLKKYFIPHRENEYHPHFIRHESMLFFFLVVIVIEVGLLVQVLVVFDKTKFLAAVLPGILTSLTNEEREENNAPPLIHNDLLTKAAEMKAQDMAEHGYFAHTSPEGKTPWYWLEQVGYKYTYAGENLAVNFFESKDVARAWMNSPSHRANIIKEDFTEIGIGVADGVYEGKHTVFVAQFFGTPRTAIAFAQEQKTPEIPTQTTPTPPLVVAPPVTPPVVLAPPVSTLVTPTTTTTEVEETPVTPTQVLGEENATVSAPVKNAPQESKVRSFIQRALTSPRESVAYTYGGIALLTTLTLMLALFIKHEVKHPAYAVRGLFLMAVIIFFLFVNIKVLRVETKVPEDITANVIAY